ncbi:MAG: hypothetical protein WA384_02680 [Rhodomicrobium sp.]
MSDEFRVLATRCGSCGCGCPTIMETADDSIVVVGSIANSLIHAAAVREKTGAGEAAVVIPKSLLIEALRSLQS